MKKLVMAAVLVALAACAPKDDAGMADTTMMAPAMSDTMNMMDTTHMMMDSNMVDSAMAGDKSQM